jgi:hypothetical protein
LVSNEHSGIRKKVSNIKLDQKSMLSRDTFISKNEIATFSNQNKSKLNHHKVYIIIRKTFANIYLGRQLSKQRQ